MSDIQLHSRIDSLPEDLKKQVADFVAFLETKSHATKKTERPQIRLRKGFLQNGG